ncbi:MAG: MFS transporter [Thermoplasmataceae archaeon]
MHRGSIILSATKSTRSFIFVSLAISAPFFLAAHGYTPLDTSLVIFASIGISTVFLYTYTALPWHTKTRLLFLSSVLAAAMIILFLGRSPLALITAIVVGGLSLGGRDYSVNQSLEQFAISTYSENQKEKNHMFTLYNFASYGSGAIASYFLFLMGAGNFTLIFAVNLVLSAVQIILYIPLNFPDVIRHEKGKAISDPAVRTDVRKLMVLFSADSLGGGLVNTAVISLWFEEVYHITLSQAGLIFIAVNIITALSVVASGYLSGRIGLVRTMVYTHLVSNVMLFLVPVFHMLALSEIFLFLRQSTSQMDVPARDSFVNTRIPRDSRVAANSSFLAVRNAFQIPGPGIAGVFMEIFPQGVFFSAALVKIAYDLAFYMGYRDYRI